MIVSFTKSENETAICAECGNDISKSNLHEIYIGNEIRFHLCYNCIKEAGLRFLSVRPEGISPWRLCEWEQDKPEEAKDCLHCRECIISSADGISDCFECLKTGFVFYEYEVPEIKPCNRN